MAGSDDGADALREAARQALARAHTAALGAQGGALRRALEDARDCLLRLPPSTGLQASADTLTEALRDLDTGALAALEPLLEAVRRQVDAA